MRRWTHTQETQHTMKDKREAFLFFPLYMMYIYNTMVWLFLPSAKNKFFNTPYHLTLGPRGGLRASHMAPSHWLPTEYSPEYSAKYSQNILWNILFLIKFFPKSNLPFLIEIEKSSNLNNFCIRHRIWVPFTALGSFWRALSSRSILESFWATSFLSIFLQETWSPDHCHPPCDPPAAPGATYNTCG